MMTDFKKDSVDQIKNIVQEKKIKPEIQKEIPTEIKASSKIIINSFDKLIEICTVNRDMKLKYELEKNVNLVNFEKNRIEISFNDNLDKNFVKDLSLKLYEWTNERWIITFSKVKGDISVKEKEQKKKIEFLKKAEETELFQNVLEKLPDAHLVDVKLKNKQEE